MKKLFALIFACTFDPALAQDFAEDIVLLKSDVRPGSWDETSRGKIHAMD